LRKNRFASTAAMLLKLSKEAYRRAFESLVKKWREQGGRIRKDAEHKVEVLYDVAEPQWMRDILKKVPGCREMDLKPYGGDYYILVDGYLVEVIERKAGMDFIGSIRSGGTRDSLARAKERWSSQVDKLLRLPTPTITLLDEYKKVKEETLDRTVGMIPQMVGELTTAHCEHHFSHISTAHSDATLYYILKTAKKYAASAKKALLHAQYFVPFADWQVAQREALAESERATREHDAATRDHEALEAHAPRREQWTLTEDDLRQLETFPIAKPKQKTPKMMFLFTASLFLSTAEVWTLIRYFESWAHFILYLHHEDHQNVMDWMSQLPKVGPSRDTLESVDCDLDESQILGNESAVVSMGRDEEDEDDEEEQPEEIEEVEEVVGGDGKKIKKPRKKQTGPKNLGPALVRKVYKFFAPEVTLTCGKKARTTLQRIKAGLPGDPMQPATYSTLVKKLESGKASSSSVPPVALKKKKSKKPVAEHSEEEEADAPVKRSKHGKVKQAPVVVETKEEDEVEAVVEEDDEEIKVPKKKKRKAKKVICEDHEDNDE
jgi:hypothetical protein